MDPRSRVALVTGSARRLGRAIARALAEAGADVAVHHHASPDAAAEAAAELRGFDVRAEVVRADLRDPAEIARLFEEIERTFGRLDILINSAAVFERRAVLELTPEDWDEVVDLNLRAPFFCSQHAARLMGEAGGHIINIADVSALQPWPGYPHHSIAKAGLVMMTRVLARALAPGIRVNAIAPGPVLPPDELDARAREKLARSTALKRLGSPRDVTDAVLYLVRSEYVTGELIVVDGGRRLMSG